MSDTSGTAFPVNADDGHGQQWGLSIRDYFAAKAMQALIGLDRKDVEEIPEISYMFADQMLEARKS